MSKLLTGCVRVYVCVYCIVPFFQLCIYSILYLVHSSAYYYCYLLQANVICIVYSVNNKKSIEKVGLFFKSDNYM